jgi:hypothetical protein
MYGDCENGYGLFQFRDSKQVIHYYVGNFKNAKFNGKGIEVVLETSSVLIGEFENDSNKEGINYLLDDERANYYVGSTLTEEFSYEYPEYIPPARTASVTSNTPTQSASLTKPTAEKQKRVWGSFLKDLGGALVLVGAAVLVNELSDNASSNKNANPKVNPSNSGTKTSATQVNKTANTAQPTKAPSAPAKPKCRYHLEWRAIHDVLYISNIFSEVATTFLPPPEASVPANDFTPVSHFRSSDRVVVSEKRADLIRQYEDEGFEIKYWSKSNTCQ